MRESLLLFFSWTLMMYAQASPAEAIIMVPSNPSGNSCTSATPLLYCTANQIIYGCSGGIVRQVIPTLDSNGQMAVGFMTLGPKTIGVGPSRLPAATTGNSGYITIVTDGASTSDCTAGGGTSVALCRSSGSAWIALGGGAGGGSPGGANNSVQYNNGGAFGGIANVTATRKFLVQTGTGVAANAPSVDTLSAADIPAHSITHLSNGADPIAAATTTVRGTVTTTTATSQAASTDDSRLSDARTPTAHAASHKNGGADEVATAVAAANAIPKSSAGGTLAVGWIPDLSGTYQPLDADLTALAANASNGLWAHIGAGTGAVRTVTGTAGQITVTNGDGVAGNPTLSLAAAQLVRTCEIHIWGSGASQALQDTDDEVASCRNKTGATLTITSVECYADNGSITTTTTPIITGGLATSILSGALTCGNATFAAGTLNGAPTLASNGTIDVNITVAGTAKSVRIVIGMTL